MNNTIAGKIFLDRIVCANGYHACVCHVGRQGIFFRMNTRLALNNKNAYTYRHKNTRQIHYFCDGEPINNLCDAEEKFLTSFPC